MIAALFVIEKSNTSIVKTVINWLPKSFDIS